MQKFYFFDITKYVLEDERTSLISPTDILFPLCYSKPVLRKYEWDYRWMDYPHPAKNFKHPSDQSVATYRGHSVLRTLIRCYFSPAYRYSQIQIIITIHYNLLFCCSTHISTWSKLFTLYEVSHYFKIVSIRKGELLS